MGGGIVFRGAARLVGAAAVGAAVVPSTEAFCDVRPPASNLPRDQESLLAVSDDTATEFINANSIDKDCKSFGNVRYEHEDHCTDKGETSRGGSLRELVFYPPPSEEEIEEATKELHAAFHLSIPPQGFIPQEVSADSLIRCPIGADDMNLASIPSKTRDLASSPSSSQPFNNLGSFGVENSLVMQAFQLLQTNPKVQDVVKSLACDPAVWNAVLSNEKLLELTQEKSPDLQGSGDNDNEDNCRTKELGTMRAFKLYGLMSATKGSYNYMRGKLLSILSVMFGSMEKTLRTKGQTTAKDKTVASCMMLTVAVVILVVVRRSMRKVESGSYFKGFPF